MRIVVLILSLLFQLPQIGFAESDPISLVRSGDVNSIVKRLDKGDLSVSPTDYRQILEVIRSEDVSVNQLNASIEMLTELELHTSEFTKLIYSKFMSDDKAIAESAIESAFCFHVYGPSVFFESIKGLSSSILDLLKRSVKYNDKAIFFRKAIEELIIADNDEFSVRRLISDFIGAIYIDEAISLFRSLYIRRIFKKASIVISEIGSSIRYRPGEPINDQFDKFRQLIDHLAEQREPDLNQDLHIAVLKAVELQSIKSSSLKKLAWSCLESDKKPYYAATYLQRSKLSKDESKRLGNLLEARVTKDSELVLELLPVLIGVCGLNKDLAKLYKDSFGKCVGKSSRYDGVIVSSYWKQEPKFYRFAIRTMLHGRSIYQCEFIQASLDKNYPKKLPEDILSLLQTVAKSGKFPAHRVQAYLKKRVQ